MAHIPEDVQWFLADLVEEIRVQGRKRNVVHINYVLVRANTRAEAYREAVKLGKRANQSYRNSEGKIVTHRFLGLHDLDAIFEPLEHGCEIMFTERIGLSAAGLRRLIRKKQELEAFLPIRPRRGRPDYSSQEIIDIAEGEPTKPKTAEPSSVPNRRPAHSRSIRASRKGGGR
jgi:hypothetical protein